MFEFIKLLKEVSQNQDLQDLAKIYEKHTGKDVTSSLNTIKEISDTIDSIDNNFQELQSAKKSGKTTTQWLTQKLEDNLKDYSQQQKDEIIAEIVTPLSKNNQTTIKEISEVELPIPKIPSFKGLNKTKVATTLKNELKKNTILEAVVVEENKIKIDTKHEEVQEFKNYFDRKLQTPEDRIIKKAVTTATIIAKEKKILPKSIQKKIDKVTNSDIASIVDNGMTTMKVAYKVAKGEMKTSDVTDYMIDRKASIITTKISHTTIKAGSAIGSKVGAAIGTIFGPIGTALGSYVGGMIGAYAGKKVGDFINKGIEKVADVAKKAVTKTIETAKKVGKAVVNGIKNFAKKSFSW